MTSLTDSREETIQRALNAHYAGEYVSIRAAARAYAIPPSTLQARANGVPIRRDAHTKRQRLSPPQERLLAKWILELDATGHAPSLAQVKEMAFLTIQVSTGVSAPRPVSDNWISRFKKRNPSIATLIGRPLDTLRAKGTSKEALSEWFDLIKRHIIDCGIQPENIYNMDETGIALGVCANQYVLGASGKKRTRVITPHNREWVSIVETIGVNGQILTPLVIFKGQSMQTNWFEIENVSKWYYASSENGWTSNEIALRWLDQIFIRETDASVQQKQPKVLIMDGHKTHCTTEFMWACRQNNILLLYLPAHSSHVTQPLDLTCFSPIKGRYRRQIQNLAKFDDGAPIKKQQFLMYYNQARKDSLKPQVIKNGWRASGIWPYNPDKAINGAMATVGRSEINSAPQTPSKKRSYKENTSWIYTPRNASQLREITEHLQSSTYDSRTVRRVIQKTQKGFELLQTSEAQALYKYNGIKAKMDTFYTQKSSMRIQLKPNELFASIDDIQAAKVAAKAAEEAKQQMAIQRTQNKRSTSNIATTFTSIAHNQAPMDSFLHSFQI